MMIKGHTSNGPCVHAVNNANRRAALAIACYRVQLWNKRAREVIGCVQNTNNKVAKRWPGPVDGGISWT